MTETLFAPGEPAEPSHARDDLDAFRRRIHRTLDAGGVDEPTRPATAKLVHDQADVIIDLLDGFDTREEILQWQLDLVVHSLGQLEDNWYTRTAADAATVSVLLGEPWGQVDAIDDVLAREVRRGIVAKDLLPAFHAAHETFRWAAVERVDHLDDDGDGDAPEPIDPTAQQYPAMRPAFGELHGQQQEALRALLDGFDSEDDLLLWSLQVTRSSYAEIDRETAEAPYFERPLREHLLTPTSEKDRWIRASWAAEFVVPAFNRAAAQLADRAAEVTAGQSAAGPSVAGDIS